MNPLDPELLSLTNELSKLGGSRKVKLGRISVFIKGVNNVPPPVNNANFISFIEENNQIIIRHPSSANDMRCYDTTKYFGPTVPNERISGGIVNKITTSIFDGFNVNLITYGATNTGKSQLLFGSSSDNMKYDSCEGLFGTLSANIFRKIDQSNDKITLSISLWEIGHNQITDLLNNDKNHQIQSPFDLYSVTISNWKELTNVWDIARHNCRNWNGINTGYEIIPNETNLFIQLKIYNQTQKRVTTFNLIDLVGCQHTARPLRPHISRDKVEQNKTKNVNLFSLNKLLHHLCNIHNQNQDNNTKKDLVQNVIAESLLNNFIGPMITQNAETIFLGTVSCNSSDYQPSLRTIQVLSRTLSIKVPCIHTPLFNKNNISQNIITFGQFVTKWQSILYKHMMIENSIQQQINQFDEDQQLPFNDNISDCSDTNIHPSNITQAIDNLDMSFNEQELNTKMLDQQLQELRKNIPRHVSFQFDNNANPKQTEPNKEIKKEISLLLDDILDSKDGPKYNASENTINKNARNINMGNDNSFLKSRDFEQMFRITDECKTNSKHSESHEIELPNMNNDKQEYNTITHINFTNLRLENCKLKEEIRKLKTQSKYSSIYDDYDREMKTLHKLIESIANENKLLTMKNMELKHELNNNKFNPNVNNNVNTNIKSNELKTVRSLQRSLRETTKKLKEKETLLMKLTSDIRHSDIRKRVLQNSKQEWYDMSRLLNKRESELAQSYLSQAQKQAVVDKLQLKITQLEHENNTLITQTESLENEVCTLRHVCKRINDDIKQSNQLQRVSKKWASKKR
eukprot:178442_1